MYYTMLQMQYKQKNFCWILIIKTMPKIQELLIFLESERFFSKFKVEITFLKFYSIFSLIYTTYVVYYTTNAVYYTTNIV